MQSYLNKILNKVNWKKNKKYIIGGLVFLVLVILIAGGNKDENIVRGQVTRGEISSVISLSGKVESQNNVSLRFPTSGTVANVAVTEGQYVEAGTRIVELENQSLRADLLKATANLDLARAEAKVSDAETDVDVKNAYSDLLNNDLQAYPADENSDYSLTPPVVVGSYLGNREGEYNIEIYSSKASSGASFNYTGLERGSSTVNEYTLSDLGKLGLFLQFEESENYSGTDWVVPIPNIKSSSYASALSRYNSAVASRDAAESGNISRDISNAKIKQAEAEVYKIQAEINERIIRAPFPGVVSNINVKKGELANTTDEVVTMISPNNYEIKIQIPEVDLSSVKTGLETEIKLDAYPKDVFKGTIYSVDQAETLVEGVSVYEAVVKFNDQDERVKSGMTANVAIVSEKKENVLLIKKQFIEKDDVGEFVNIYLDEKEIKSYITKGITGTDGNVEITSGLVEGDIIIGRFE